MKAGDDNPSVRILQLGFIRDGNVYHENRAVLVSLNLQITTEVAQAFLHPAQTYSRRNLPVYAITHSLPRIANLHGQALGFALDRD